MYTTLLSSYHRPNPANPLFDIYETVDVNGEDEVFVLGTDLSCEDVGHCERECSDIYSGSSEELQRRH